MWRIVVLLVISVVVSTPLVVWAQDKPGKPVPEGDEKKPGKKPDPTKKPKKKKAKPSPKPRPDWILIRKVRFLLEKKKSEQALLFADRIASNFPKSRYAAEGLYVAGEVHYTRGRFYEAHVRFRRLLEKYQGFKKLGQVIRREFEIGMAYIRGKKNMTWLGIEVSAANLGQEILSNLVKHYDQEGFDDAMYQIGEYWFRKDSWIRAAEGYERLIEEYPESEWVPAARFKVALTHLNRSHGYNHDLRPIHKAEKLLKEYIRDYPAGGLVENAEETLARIRESLSRRDINVADFYLDRDKPMSAAVYLEVVLRLRPETKSVKLAVKKLTRIADGRDKKSSRFAKKILRKWHRSQGKAAPEK